MARRSLPLGGILLFLAAGCGSDRPEMAPVTGTVLLNGQPVIEAGVTFMPSAGRPATGQSDEAGRFELTTFNSGDGAVLGQHVVTITKTETREVTYPDGGREPVEKIVRPPGRLVPPRYSDPGQSNLSATVTADGENDFTFELTD